jgi:hypothetical protein
VQYSGGTTGVAREAVDVTWYALKGLILIGGGLVAWRNVRLGRADRRGTVRLAGVTLAAAGLGWALTADFSAPFAAQLHLFVYAVGTLLVELAPLWVAYLALEPYVRRRWPWRIVAWNRLLAGRGRDPLVGRDVLVGVAFGTGTGVVGGLVNLAPGWLGRPPTAPWYYLFGDALTAPAILSSVFGLLAYGVLYAVLITGVLCLLFLVCRREGLTVAAVFVLFGLLFLSLTEGRDVVTTGFTLAWLGASLFLLLRFGLLALATAFFTFQVLMATRVTFDLAVWYGPNTLIAAGVLAGLAGYSCVVALGGRPLFRDDLLAGA